MGEPRSCRILLVRHGQTASTDVVAGHIGCPGLSDYGREQVERLSQRFMREPLDGVVALYSSTIRRAIETAELLADSLGADSIAQDCGLCELHDGVVDGLPVDQVIEEVWRPRSRSSVRLPWGPNAQDGESIPDLVARASSALWRIVHDHSAETVVVATHGGVIRSSFLCFGDESFRSAWARSPQNASITEWIVPIPEPGVRQLGPGSTYSGARLVRYDDVVHLDQ